ncbi:helix-turn-helix domain-containing protein [Micromonospora krabiensis]|uniref:helix-turn-helix domain-containing protein n=1 Tax=Micromonospora krabiensis TaxID=307121 RepID=UPI001E293C96|nr:XRE family transcriptional regulator [Micromonospora krabiensis]
MRTSARPARPVDPQPSLVGARMRQFRTERGLTLRGLAARAGLSIGFLSQVERGVSSIGLTALNSVAAALDRPVAEFFESSPAPTPADAAPAQAGAAPAEAGPTPTRVAAAAPEVTAAAPRPPHFTLTRAESGATEYVSGQQTYRMLSDRGANLVLEPMLVHIAPGGRREEAYGHEGEEFAYVVRGELLYEVDGEEHRLYPGDSVHLRSSVPHRLYNDTDEVTTVVSVVTPRLF